MSDDLKKRVLPVILPHNIQGGEFIRNIWAVSVPNETERDDLENPKFWEPIAGKVRIGDHLEVMPEDGAWYALLIVRNKEGATIKTGGLLYREFDDAAIPSAKIGADLIVKWRGPVRKFGVVRDSDGAVLKENFTTKGEAFAWASEHDRAFN